MKSNSSIIKAFKNIKSSISHIYHLVQDNFNKESVEKFFNNKIFNYNLKKQDLTKVTSDEKDYSYYKSYSEYPNINKHDILEDERYTREPSQPIIKQSYTHNYSSIDEIVNDLVSDLKQDVSKDPSPSISPASPKTLIIVEIPVDDETPIIQRTNITSQTNLEKHLSITAAESIKLYEEVMKDLAEFMGNSSTACAS